MECNVEIASFGRCGSVATGNQHARIGGVGGWRDLDVKLEIGCAFTPAPLPKSTAESGGLVEVHRGLRNRIPGDIAGAAEGGEVGRNSVPIAGQGVRFQSANALQARAVRFDLAGVSNFEGHALSRTDRLLKTYHRFAERAGVVHV